MNKLLIPFLFWHLVSIALVPFLSKTTIFEWSLLWDFVVPRGNPHNTALWFLVCLFLLNIIFYFVVALCNKVENYKTCLIMCFTFIVGMSGFFLGQYDIHLILKFETVMTAMPFFCLGYIIGKNRNLLTTRKYYKYWILTAIASMAVTYMIAKAPANYWSNTYSGLSAFVLYLGGITGVTFILSVSKLLVRLPLVSFWGRYSIMVLVTHMPLVLHLSYYLQAKGLSIIPCSLISTSVIMLSYLVFIPFFKRFLPYVMAQKDVFII